MTLFSRSIICDKIVSRKFFELCAAVRRCCTALLNSARIYLYIYACMYNICCILIYITLVGLLQYHDTAEITKTYISIPRPVVVYIYVYNIIYYYIIILLYTHPNGVVHIYRAFLLDRAIFFFFLLSSVRIHIYVFSVHVYTLCPSSKLFPSEIRLQNHAISCPVRCVCVCVLSSSVYIYIIIFCIYTRRPNEINRKRR